MFEDLMIDGVRGFRVIISGELYRACDSFSKMMWANEKTGEWGGGMVNHKKDPRRVERIGCLGEMAFSEISGIPMSMEYRKGGDRHDFFLKDGTSVNVKTASRNYGKGLVRAVSADGYDLDLQSDMYVFGYIEKEDVLRGCSAVVLVGYETRHRIATRKIKPAMVGNHQNYEIPFRELGDLRDIV